MKLCSRHSHDLVDLLKRKGLWRLVSTEPATMKYRAEKWLKGHALTHDIDPLVISILELNAKAVELCGNYVLGTKIGGAEHCPLCEAGRVVGPEADQCWADNCTDAVLAVCIANGLTHSH